MIAYYQNKKVLVTGGAGFIGSELVRQLVSQGAQVTVVDSLVNGKKENLDGLLSQVNLAVTDIRDEKSLMKLLEETDILFHLACLGLRHSLHSPEENHEVNATATLKLLSLARKARAKRFVYVSSSEVYGTGQEVPMTETHPTFPRQVYGAAKLAGEGYARAFYESYGFPAVVVRPFNTYGPRSHHEGDSGEVIPKFLLRSLALRPLVIFGDGTQTRDFTYVSDTAKGILLAGFRPEAVGQTLNLASGKEISINGLAREVMAVTGREVPLEHDVPRPGDTLRLLGDASKAKQILGFEPQISLRDGMSKLKEWYLGRGIPVEKLLEEEVVRNWEKKSYSYR